MNCPNPEAPSSAESDRLVAATIYLMSCHARCNCPRLAHMVVRHLEQIARDPGCGERVADTCMRLANAWEAIRRHDEIAARAPMRVAAPLH
jgi:hypothetical protein